MRKTLWAALATSALMLAASGCAVSRGQETVGAYIDDAAITSTVKARLFEDKDVAGSSISVETLKGTVLLSGFAKTPLNAAKLKALHVGSRASLRSEMRSPYALEQDGAWARCR